VNGWSITLVGVDILTGKSITTSVVAIDVGGIDSVDSIIIAAVMSSADIVGSESGPTVKFQLTLNGTSVICKFSKSASLE